MKEASEEETREFITDLPVTEDEADQARGGTEDLPFAGQTIRLRIATTNNRGHYKYADEQQNVGVFVS